MIQEIPDGLWQRPEMLAALRTRDISQVFRLVRRHAGASQTVIGGMVGMSQGKVSGIVGGSHRVSALEVFERIADGLDMPDNARLALGLAPRVTRSVGVDVPGRDDEPVRRRDFSGLTGAALLSATLSGGDVAKTVNHLVMALTGSAETSAETVPLDRLAATVSHAKQNYQACRYSDVLADLPALLGSLRVACDVFEADDRRRAHALSAEAYHVTASILLKQEDKGLAWLAADRSVHAARLSEDPLMIGAGARIITRALMSDSRYEAAAQNAATAAVRMDADLSDPSADDLSVYGLLLLQGAIAAALNGRRHTATELLDEAEAAGRRLGHDGNYMWTAFGPNNVLCHRVSAALTLGDAGTAIDCARRVDIDALPVNERKATLLLDTSRAFLMWGKHDRALGVLQAAAGIAPEEITSRPTTRRLVEDLTATAPPSVRGEVHAFADALGLSA